MDCDGKEKETADERGQKKAHTLHSKIMKIMNKKEHNNSKSKNSDKSPPLFIINTTGFS